jgi:cytosine/adenosine deaminase-related metal-dependent hydrolase
MLRTSLRARYVFPITSPPLRDGVVTLDGERIVAVGENRSGRPPIDLGNVALLPGLVNTHTHLEFSDCRQPLGRPGMPLPDWIREVMRQRHTRTAEPQAAIVQGLAECFATGTTTLGEIATSDWSLPQDYELPLHVTRFQELIGLSPERIEPLVDRAKAICSASFRETDNPRSAISPHAPYSVHPQVVSRVCQFSGQSGGLVAMHLAESREELQLLATGTGPFVDLLAELGVWQPEVFCQPRRPLDYLQDLGIAARALVIHGNYLDDQELSFLAQHRDHMSLVYCPRTHAYFQHEPYPLAQALSLGVHIALGTDSRASNPDLNLLEEMRFIARAHPDVAPEDILRMGTLSGVQALGRAGEIGSLEIEKLANLTAVTLPDFQGKPYDLLLQHPGGPIQTWYRGIGFRGNVIS